MWRLPEDMTFRQVSGRTGVKLQLLLQENPFGGGGKLNGNTLLEAGTVVFTADDDHLPRHPDLPAFTMADSPAHYAFLGGPSVLREAAKAAQRGTPFPDTPELIRMQVRDVPIPKNNREASTGPYAHKWQAADRVEMEQMFDKGVLEPVNRADIPPGYKPIQARARCGGALQHGVLPVRRRGGVSPP